MASIAHGDLCVNRCTVPQSIPTKQADARALLAAANERLMARRAQLAQQRPARQEQNAGAPSAEFPPHLGWGTAGSIPRASSHSRVPSGNAVFDAIRPSALNPVQDTLRPSLHSDGDCQNESVVVQPSLLAGMLKGEVVAIGRIYLLCRHIDRSGRGWLAVDDVREQLTSKTSPLRVCGWRRLRQILQAGKEVFWERDDHGRLWLYGLTRVAALLNVQHFSGDSVELPFDTLLSSIGELRATFYATFHSGRDSSPITRATLRDITGVPERTQRNYDSAQSIAITPNFTLLDNANTHDVTFEKGRAAFQFNDKLGRHGMAGKQYIAVRLPNSYQVSRFTRLSNNQKRLNKRLQQDLVKYGTRGNSSGSRRQIFFTDGKAVAKNKCRSDLYLAEGTYKCGTFWISFSA